MSERGKVLCGGEREETGECGRIGYFVLRLSPVFALAAALAPRQSSGDRKGFKEIEIGESKMENVSVSACACACNGLMQVMGCWERTRART